MNDGERLDDWWNELIPSGIKDAVQQATEEQRGEVSAALQSAQLTQEKLQDALSTIKALTRERDEMESIAERTHGDLLKAQSELDKAIKRAQVAEYQRDRALSYADHCYNAGHIGAARIPWEVYLRV